MSNNLNHSDLLQNASLEMRRGTVILAVLSQLDEPQYGYSLLKQLTDQGFEIDQGTLYPLLRRLESQKLLESQWRIEDPRPRRYYVISALGRAFRADLQAEWKALSGKMNTLLDRERS